MYIDDLSRLVSSIAQLVGAAAFPVVILVSLVIFRKEIKAVIGAACMVLNRVQKATFPGLGVELSCVADLEVVAENNGQVTARQVEAAARIKVQSIDSGSQVITNELDKLCLEYDGLRRSMPASRDRTNAMTRIVVKMRLLAPSVLEFMDVYRGSGSPGSRLAAVSMMQMAPQQADLAWLEGRFSVEQPFIFYHAALALQNVANVVKGRADRDQLLSVAQRALVTVQSFNGEPDSQTINVLSGLIGSLKSERVTDAAHPTAVPGTARNHGPS